MVSELLREYAKQYQQYQDDRAAPRFPLEGRLTLGVAVGDDPSYRPLHQAWLTDLSEVGVGFLVENPLEKMMRLYVNLEVMTNRPCLLPIKVVYCRKLLSHTYRVGACFVWEESQAA